MDEFGNPEWFCDHAQQETMCHECEECSECGCDCDRVNVTNGYEVYVVVGDGWQRGKVVEVNDKSNELKIYIDFDSFRWYTTIDRWSRNWRPVR